MRSHSGVEPHRTTSAIKSALVGKVFPFATTNQLAQLTLPSATMTILCASQLETSERVKVMRTFRICGCFLMLFPLLGILGCTKSAYVKKGPEVRTNTVKISACTANPDTARVPKGTTLTWIIDPPDGHSYSVSFPNRTPVSSSTVPIGQAQTVTGDFWCNSLGWTSPGLCLYGYNVVQDGSKTCPDPGVHVGS